MKYRYGYNRVIAAATYPLNSTTATAIKANPEQILGKAVTLTGTTEPEVGYGSNGNMLKGIVTAIEKEDNNSDRFVVTVAYKGQFEDVPTSTTGKAVVGKGLAVNGKGEVITSETMANAYCESVNESTCIITIC